MDGLSAMGQCHLVDADATAALGRELALARGKVLARARELALAAGVGGVGITVASRLRPSLPAATRMAALGQEISL